MEQREVRVGVRELRGNLSRYLNEASEGASILVTSRDVVIAEIRAPAPPVGPKQNRQPGRMEGQIWMADDFDEWPEDILDLMES